MSRLEQDREDLLREATALVARVELAVPGEPAPVVAGFRRRGELSVYYGAEPVYQFNAAGQLRRAYADGLVVKAERGYLVRMQRQREAGQTVLWHRWLSEEELGAFLRAMHGRLQRLAKALAAQDYAIIGQVPPAAGTVERLARWLASHADEVRIATTARV